jgi:hypothetical protein
MKLINAMHYLCEDLMYLTVGYPRIYQRQINRIQELTGCLLQVESLYGAEKGSPRVVYPLFQDQYNAAVKALDVKLLEVSE